MPYFVKELFHTLQGEGAQAGRAAVFCRFTACNLWSGLESDRATAVCRFCDTDFVGTDGPNGGRFEMAAELAGEICRIWNAAVAPAFAAQPLSLAPSHRVGGRPYVVFTGGEPLLQLDSPLIEAVHAVGFQIAVETNGTRGAPAGIDWICVSPKAGAELVQRTGHELKLVHPQPGAEPARYELLDFTNFYLQPMDGPHRMENERLVVDYCRRHPQWRVSLQTQKILRIP